jgi:hypothetical protein
VLNTCDRRYTIGPPVASQHRQQVVGATRWAMKWNDEGRKPNDEGMTKPEGAVRHSDLVLRASFVIWLSTFVIPSFGALRNRLAIRRLGEGGVRL